MKKRLILVDAIFCLISEDGHVFKAMYDLLETYPNKKILLTGADDKQFKKFGLDKAPYEVFTLKHNPEKTDPEYYRTMLSKLNLEASEVVYFEHNIDAIKSAQSVGIKTYLYDDSKKNLDELKNFLDTNI